MFWFFCLRDEDQTCSTTDDLTSNEFEQPPQKKQKQQTLMDFAKAENHWSTSKNNEQATALKEYQIKFYKDKKEAVNYIESYLWNSKINSKVLLHYSIIVLFKKHIKDVDRENAFNLNILITTVSNLIWYMSPHHSKFVAHGASLPTVYNHLLLFNDPNSHKQNSKHLQKS